jgi:hypothetical protein
MNKSRMKKNAWSHVGIRPVAKRFYGADGPQLPPIDDDWLIQGVEDAGVKRFKRNHGLIPFSQHAPACAETSQPAQLHHPVRYGYAGIFP